MVSGHARRPGPRPVVAGGALGILAAALSASAAFSQSSGRANPGVTDERVLFGQSAALTGPAAALGQGMRRGIRAAFSEANRAGGVHGRRLELISKDDGYEPEAALRNTRELLNEDGVFALIGPVGTPTSRTAAPVAVEAGAPYIGPFTGAEFLRNPAVAPTAVNVRASYGQETDEMVERLTTDLGITRIAVLHQDDSYGNAGLTGVERALARRGLEMTGVAAYPRNTTAVKVAVLQLRRTRPEAVIIIGAYRPVGEFVRWSRRIGFDPVMVNISFVGGDALAAELGADGEGVVITQVVPFPGDTALPVVERYQLALRREDPRASPGFPSLEGYIAGRLTVQVLRRAGAELTREGFLETLSGVRGMDFGGFSLSYGPGDTQGSDRVFLTRIEADGELRPLANLR